MKEKKYRISGNIFVSTIFSIISIALAAIALIISITDLAIKLNEPKGSNGGKVVSDFDKGYYEKNINIKTNKGKFVFGVEQQSVKYLLNMLLNTKELMAINFI